MKKVLFASTALVAFAGAASAEVTLSGSAEMGIVGGNNDRATQFHTDIDVTFTMSGETDGGLTFGASIDLDESNDNDAFSASSQGGETIFISGGFGTVTMGDTDGAFDWAMNEVLFNNGSIEDNEETLGYNGNAGLDGLYDGQILRYDNTIGGFGFALSVELDDSDAVGNDDVLGLGVKYDLDLGGNAIGVGFGYQTASIGNVDVDVMGISLDGTFGDFSAGLNYSTYENHFPSLNDSLATAFGTATGRFITPGQDTDHIGIGVGYATGAISVSLNYGQFDHDVGLKVSGIGLSAGYDLGGGAEVQFGYGNSSFDLPAGFAAIDDVNTYSLGVAMSF